MAEEAINTVGGDLAIVVQQTIEAPAEPGHDSGQRAKKAPLGAGAWVAIVWLIIVLLCAILAPFFVHPTVNLDNPEFARSAPTLTHPFGGDGNAIDVFQQVVRGTTTSIGVSVGAVSIGLLIGGALGLISWFFGGKVDLIMSNSFSILLAFPQLVLALALVSSLAGAPDTSSTRRIFVLILGLGIVAIPLLARITRANTMVWAEREFVMAAKAMGAKRWRHLGWHRRSGGTRHACGIFDTQWLGGMDDGRLPNLP